jgi:hypothetical protein
MVEVDGVNQDAIQVQGAVGQIIKIIDPGLEVVKGHRKKAVSHVAVEDPGHGLEGRGPAIDEDLGGLMVNRLKKGDAQQVVPVAVAEEQVKTTGNIVFHKMLAQEPHAGAAVDHDSVAVVQYYFNAGGVAAELEGIGAGSRDGTPGAPEFNLHMKGLLLSAGLMVEEISE